MMNPGKMRSRVTILARTEAAEPDELNQPVFNFDPIRTIWAQQINRGAEEVTTATGTYARRLVTFRMWYQPDLDEVDRLECDGYVYDIKGIEEIGWREGTEVTGELRPAL